MFSLAFVCLFVCLAELGKDNRLSRFSQNSVERWHKGQGRNDSAYILVVIWIRIQIGILK